MYRIRWIGTRQKCQKNCKRISTASYILKSNSRFVGTCSLCRKNSFLQVETCLRPDFPAHLDIYNIIIYQLNSESIQLKFGYFTQHLSLSRFSLFKIIFFNAFTKPPKKVFSIEIYRQRSWFMKMQLLNSPVAQSFRICGESIWKVYSCRLTDICRQQASTHAIWSPFLCISHCIEFNNVLVFSMFNSYVQHNATENAGTNRAEKNNYKP